MKWKKTIVLTFVALTLFIGSWAFPNRSYADKPQFFEHLYLLKSVKMYNSRTTAKKPAGTLAADQVMTVMDTDVKISWDDSPQWYLVKTPLGNKWIKADYQAMYTGTYAKQDRKVTSEFAMELYDRPGTQATSNRIAPQKLHVTASFVYGPVPPVTAVEMIMSDVKWYQVDTWLGKKWIRNPALLEDVKAKEVSYTVKLTGQETAYPYPFVVESAAETLEPQVVQVTGGWIAGIGPSETGWIRIRLNGEDKWFSPQNLMLDTYEELNESIVLQTETRYFDQPPVVPGGGTLDDWLPPGSYEAFEASGDYVHIRTDQGDLWVNPSRALLERPVGIEPTDEKIQLTKESQYYWFPNTGEEMHTKGFYKPQTVKAFEKWKSEDGGTYYHFHSFAGDEWVLIP